MDTICATNSSRFEQGIRATLSLKETTVLADISEGRLRKDVENGVLCPARAIETRPCFRWPDVFFLGAVYRTDSLTRSARGKVYRLMVQALLQPSYRHHYDIFVCNKHELSRIWETPSNLITECDQMKIDDTLYINVGHVLGDLVPKVDLYARGLSRIEENDGILGGEAVFKNTRLPVRHIGKMSVGGEPINEILLDYPYLREDDVTFARLYYEAHPAVGRPRTRAETTDAKNDR
jgi:uncharacterized protein (DUF433 family)